MHRPERLRRLLADFAREFPNATVMQEPIKEVALVRVSVSVDDGEISEVWTLDTTQKAILAAHNTAMAVEAVQTYIREQEEENA